MQTQQLGLICGIVLLTLSACATVSRPLPLADTDQSSDGSAAPAESPGAAGTPGKSGAPGAQAGNGGGARAGSGSGATTGGSGGSGARAASGPGGPALQPAGVAPGTPAAGTPLRAAVAVELDDRANAGGGSGNGASARVTADGNDDDIIARRLRTAAEQEHDPVLKKKLWHEYLQYLRYGRAE